LTPFLWYNTHMKITIQELASFTNEVDATGYEIIETEDIFGDDDEV